MTDLKNVSMIPFMISRGCIFEKTFTPFIICDPVGGKHIPAPWFVYGMISDWIDWKIQLFLGMDGGFRRKRGIPSRHRCPFWSPGLCSALFWSLVSFMYWMWNMSHFKHLFMSVLVLRLSSCRAIYIGMYCGRTFGFKSCVYTVHIQVCTWGNNKLQGSESKPVNQLGKFGRNVLQYSRFCNAMKCRIEPMTGCARLKW